MNSILSSAVMGSSKAFGSLKSAGEMKIKRWYRCIFKTNPLVFLGELQATSKEEMRLFQPI
jgi:hypothetical protein